jgi:CheY-like chemotaxis protein
MPEVSGFDVLKVTKEDPILSKIPILVLTNIFADAEDLVKNWGVRYFLLKADHTPETIVNKVNLILTRDNAKKIS